MMRGAATAALVATLLVLTGCSIRFTGQTATTCGIPYTVQIGARTVSVGSCAALLPMKPTQVRVPVGTDFSIAILNDVGGARDFPVPAPANSRVRLLYRDGSVVTYRAREIGTLDLVAHKTRYCLALGGLMGSCDVIRVTISGR